jgi:hypothetical protein
MEGIRSPKWNLSENVKKAIEDGHPWPELVTELSNVISGEKDIKDLDRFEAWTQE